MPQKWRIRLLRLHGIRCDADVFVHEGTFFGSHKVILRKGCFISVRCLFDGCDWIDIGERAFIAMGVQLITGTHPIGPSAQRAGQLITAPIKVGAGCWLGAGVIVLPGVVIGDGCVIAAGSVVTKSTNPDGLYAGVPAKRIRDLEN